jgi:GT2 family glycosyltransferase
MKFISVSIVIPNYNGEPILKKNLASVVEAADAYPGKCEIIVVDDASQDDSVDLIEHNFPDVKIIRHDINHGFSETVASGVRAATHAIIILLNSDVRPDRGFIEPMISWFEREDIFAVSPLIRDHRHNPVRVSWVRARLKRGEIRKSDWDLDVALGMVNRGIDLKSLYASGGSMAFSKDRFIALGGFLPLYKPFYGEDVDLGIRAWCNGWQTVFEPRSSVVHDHVGTIRRFFSHSRIRLIRKRNRFFYQWLHLSARKLFFSHIPWIFLRLPARLFKMDVIYPIALIQALLMLMTVISARKQLNRQGSRRSLEQILEHIRLSNRSKDVNKPIQKVIFIGKSKKKTGTTKFMFNALKRRVKKAAFINVPRLKKLYFWTDHKKAIQKRIIQADPDLIFFYSKDIPYRVLKDIHSYYQIAMFYGDTMDPYAEEVLRYARLVDYLFVINKSYLDKYTSLGVKNAFYITQGCDRDAHRVIPTQNPKWASDVAFIGRPHRDHRIKLLQMIDRRCNLKVWGGEWHAYNLICLKQRIYPKEFAKICFAAKIFLGCDYDYDLEGYFTIRTWYALGCGGFLVTNYLPGMETIFKKGIHLEWYHNPEECLDLIDYYLKHESERKKIARCGYEYAHSTRTYDIVMDELITRIENDTVLK